MGFDVFGIRPRSEAGQYFRNNIWWWRRLWDFCVHVTPEFTEDDANQGHWNNGHVIEGEKHASLVRNLEKALQDKGRYQAWIADSEQRYLRNSQAVRLRIRGSKATEYPDFNTCNHPFAWANVEEFLEFLKANAGFQIC